MIAWVAPALAAPLLFAVVMLVDKRVLSEFRLPIRSFNLWVGGSQAMFGTAVLVIDPPSGLTWEPVLGSMAIGVLQGLGLVLMFWVLSREDASRVAPVFQSSPMLVALAAVFLFGEALSGYQWLGVALAVGGTMLVSVRLGDGVRGAGMRPVIALLLVGAAFSAAAQLVTKSVADDLPVRHVVAFRGLGLFVVMGGLFARPAAVAELARFLARPRRGLWLVMSEGVLPFTGHLLIVTAIARAPVSLVAPLLGTRPLFVFTGSFLGSRLRAGVVPEAFGRGDLLVKAAGALLVVAAVALIAAG